MRKHDGLYAYNRGRQTSSFSPGRTPTSRLHTPDKSTAAQLQLKQAQQYVDESSALLKTHLWQLYSTVNSQQARIQSQEAELAVLRDSIKRADNQQLNDFRPVDSPRLARLKEVNRGHWREAEDLLFRLKQAEAQSQRQSRPRQ